MNGTSGGNGGDGALQARIDQLLELVTARARGEVGTETVEEAVAQLLSTSTSATSSSAAAGRGTGGATRANGVDPPAAAPAPAAASAAAGAKILVEDDDDYDNLEEEKEGDEEKPVSSSSPTTSASASGREGKRGTKRPRSSIGAKKSTDTDEDYVGSGSSAEHDDEDGNTVDESKRYDELDSIPLGRVGAKMMVTFGDGRHPRPEAVEAALMGARRLIQYAVRDARALRRKHKAEYKKAQAAATLHTKRPKYIDKETVESLRDTTVDSSMLFRAIGGYDRISYDPMCGFDVPELEVLFPEEMMAYQRWKRMQKAYARSKDDRGDGDGRDEDGDGDEDDNDNDADDGASKNGGSASAEKGDDHDEAVGGHLNRRLKQFDARTEQMKEKWYLSFSEVRQGSFIDKATGADGRMWRKAQKKRKQAKKTARGRPKGRTVTWESLPPGCVTFLHWIGFDVTSAIPPPNEATANALAFLAYDFMGKIVEKAIFIRCLAQRDEARKSKSSEAGSGVGSDGDDFILELRGGEQLTAEDMSNALKDSTVVSEPLYGVASSSTSGGGASKPQLYFGPGFEERLEMEMEEIVHKGKHCTTAEEQKIRQEEDELFREMEKPPTRLEGVMDVLGEEHVTDEMLKKREASKATQKSNALRASSVKDPSKSKKRGRGRPRKKK